MNNIKQDKGHILITTDEEIKKNVPCYYCSSTERILTFKLIPTNREDFAFPKYVPQIKEVCAYCKRYIRFAPQTSQLIDRFNQKLQEVIIYE